MDKKKKCSAEKQSDDLNLVKAAAWAWYQHNSSSKSSSPASESPSFGSRRLSSRRHATRLPSRYHFESLSEAAKFQAPSPEKQVPVTLLDLYEIERITRELERLVVRSKMKEIKEENRRERKIKDGGGFLGRHAVMICSSGGSLVEEAVKVQRRRRVRSSEFL